MRAGISSENSSSSRSGIGKAAQLGLPSPLRGGDGGGGRRYSALNLQQHAVNICHHVIVPEAQDRVAAGHQESRSLDVVIRLFNVLSAIEFDDQARLTNQSLI